MAAEIERLNVYEGCSKKCEDCERFFDCIAPEKDIFEKRGNVALARQNLKGVKHKIIVFGGKGGVGKSMLAVNLACALAQRGKKVGLLDQVYECPAIPLMMGIQEDFQMKIGDNGLIPAEGPLGIKIVSTGLILDQDNIIIWYHDMKRNATEELLCAVDYGELDYLVVDIPAGTSSETVNALKYIPAVDGGLLITVPSEVSQNVAKRCIYIMRKAGIKPLGVIENMSDRFCPHCGEPMAIIQSGAGERMSREENVNFLGKIPISEVVSRSLDDGTPFVCAYPDSMEAKFLMQVGDAIIRQVEGEG